jgi:radical SAM/Cys-rich protein
MDRETVDKVLQVLQENPIETLDITGGAPELNPHFRYLAAEAKKAGKKVIVRTNLTIFFEPGMESFPRFYADQGVELIASLPCYLEPNIKAVRGEGAFRKSIDALRTLNALGYGTGSTGLALSLVYNPGGAFLPPVQTRLEADYKRELKARYDISFTRLYAFTNMPLGRFRNSLIRMNELEKYSAMLVSAFNAATIDNIMCRHLISVGWDGRLYDCDFNQVLGLPVTPEDNHRTIDTFDLKALAGRIINIDDHCYACTAGEGST